MFNTEDHKKGKTKHLKSENIRNAVTETVNKYLQKRHYSPIKPVDITKSQLNIYSSIINEISNPNSIRYRCYNCDPIVTDSNFSRFLIWLREPGTKEQVSSELEILVGPLFCHLYLDLSQGGHPEKAAEFFLTHLTSVEKLNKDLFVQELINSFSNIEDDAELKAQFRSNKFLVQISEEAKQKLMDFVAQNCNAIFLQVLNTWFEIEVMKHRATDSEIGLVPNECCLNAKFQDIVDAAKNLEKDQFKRIFSVAVSNTKFQVNCGVLSRYHGIFAYNQDNLVVVCSLNSCNSLSSSVDSSKVELNGHSDKVYAITLSKNYLASASCNGQICIYKIEEFEPIKECSGHERTVYCLKISNNELYLASGSEDNTIRLWNIANGNCIRIFIGHEQAVMCLDFHPNCLYLMSGSTDKFCRMWNIESAEPLRLFQGCQGTVRTMSCHPQGKFLVCASDDKRLRTFDILTGKNTYEMKVTDTHLSRLQWSRDGFFLCAAFRDNFVKIWCFKNFENSDFKSVELYQTVNCCDTILDLEYRLGTFGLLKTKAIS